MKCVDSDSAFGPQNEEEALVFAEEAFRVDTQTKIHELMLEKGLTKKDLAERLKVSGARISQVFSDRANLTIRNVARIFFALGEVPRVETTPIESTSWALSVSVPETPEPELRGFEFVTAPADGAYSPRMHYQVSKSTGASVPVAA